MWNFQDTFEIHKRSFVGPFSIYMTVPLKVNLTSWSKSNLNLKPTLKLRLGFIDLKIRFESKFEFKFELKFQLIPSSAHSRQLFLLKHKKTYCKLVRSYQLQWRKIVLLTIKFNTHRQRYARIKYKKRPP